jgi:hypothetical protein
MRRSVSETAAQLMKTTFVLLGAAILLAGSVFADPIIVKKRALEVRDQNNVRQGVTPAKLPGAPAQPSQPAAPTAPTAPNPYLQQSLAKVRANLAAIQANATVTPQQKQQLTTNLLACAQGASKPSLATLAALAESLTAALAQKPLSESSRNRLVSRLAAVLNPAGIQATQMQAVYDDIQAIFQTNEMPRKDAVKIVDQVKAVAAETQR